MLRVPSPLRPETEDLITRVIGCCITVHQALGPGLLESTYVRALCIELDENAISYEREKPMPISYRGRLLCEHRLDLVVADAVVLEVKAVDCLNPVHRAQLLNYLRASKFRVGLLVNFHAVLLKDGVKRLVL